MPTAMHLMWLSRVAQSCMLRHGAFPSTYAITLLIMNRAKVLKIAYSSKT